MYLFIFRVGQGTGSIRTVQFKNQYALHSTASFNVRNSSWIGNEVGILTLYHRKGVLKFPKISTFRKLTISGDSYIIYLYKAESKTFSSNIEFFLSSANSMLVNASAELNMDMAGISNNPVKTWITVLISYYIEEMYQ